MNNFSGITLIGLGPGDIDLITKQTWEHINQLDIIYLRTAQHPAVGGFPKALKIISGGATDAVHHAGTFSIVR